MKLSMTKTILIIVAFLSANTVLACDTPVFRYAMERWESSPYQLKVFHNRDFNAEELELLELLINSSVQKNKDANLIVETINLQRQKILPKGALPVKNKVELQVAYPLDCPVQKTVWQCEFTPENINEIINSPTRQILGTHLTNGSPIVWFFIKGTDETSSAKKLQLLKGELTKLQKKWIISQLLDNKGEPKVQLSPIVVSEYKQPQNNFLHTLLKSINSKHLATTEPMVFSFYGQGRALNALVGNEITLKNIEKQCEYLIGKCSCIVKEQNPGVDVLFNTDWTRNLGETWIDEEPMPQIGGFDSFIEEVELPELTPPEPKAVEPVVIKPVGTAQPKEKQIVKHDELKSSPLIIISVVIIAVIGIFVTLLLLKKED